MNTKKLRRTIYIAFFVSLSGQIHFGFFTEGFIVALSSIVMAIFVYCYEDLTAAYIICLSGIFSPLIRLLVDTVSGGTLYMEAVLVLPDMIFFFTYAAVYTLIYRWVIRAPRSIRNFPYAVFFSDFLSNMMEMGCRSILAGHFLYSVRLIALLAMSALVRTVIITMVIVAIETYGNLLINQERDKEYRRLLTQASVISGELRIMNKNSREVEEVMKQAYDLYYQIKDQDIPEEIVSDVLSIAKNTHEIKGDYRNVLDVLNEAFLGELKNEKLRMSEIISLERSNVMAMAKKNGYQVEIIGRVREDFDVPKTFQMMSIIRNLLTNAAEAIGQGPGRINVTVAAEKDERDPFGGACAHLISVWDNGPGIEADRMEDLFMEGYSTKFDPKTGNIQRGLGLSLVRDYVENEFGGTLDVESEPGQYTEFRIRIPADGQAEEPAFGGTL
ncbi:MAG: sensor histidine kinase [Firmicutes bacterium]|nr:sensor histidine kinase [Bacillota bacterium]